MRTRPTRRRTSAAGSCSCRTASPFATSAASTSSRRRTATSSYIDPFVWSEIDDGVEQVIFHSHPETEPRPSRTDRELAGLWSGRPFLIYGLARDELRALAGVARRGRESWRLTPEGVRHLSELGLTSEVSDTTGVRHLGDRERALHERLVGVADERVLARLQLELPGHVRLRADGRLLVDARAVQVEVVDRSTCRRS